jgi:chromosomal replication initiation ATPase DnaA
MSQDPEEQAIVFRRVTPEEFCAAYNRAVAEGGELGTTDIRAQDSLAGVDDDLAERALDARQEAPLVIELDRLGEPHWLSREEPC